jgi:predicted nuclease of predicted toxin-antitoxin system
MIFLVDQMLPVWLADWLTERGYSAEHVRRIELASADDGEIADTARERGAILITKDGDFAQPPGPGVPVIWVRFGNTTHAALAERWARVWPDVVKALDAGESLVEVR